MRDESIQDTLVIVLKNIMHTI